MAFGGVLFGLTVYKVVETSAALGGARLPNIMHVVMRDGAWAFSIVFRQWPPLQSGFNY